MPPFAIAIAVLAAWVFQMGLSALQLQRYYKRLSTLRKLGRCATGMGGGRYRGRAYATLVVDPATRVVTQAERLTGFSVFAGLRPMPSLVGVPLADLTLDNATVTVLPPRLREAVRNAAGEIQRSFEPGATKPATAAGHPAPTARPFSGGARTAVSATQPTTPTAPKSSRSGSAPIPGA